MRKTRILAFVLTVVMLFSVASVCASAYTYNELKGAVGAGNVVFYADFNELVLEQKSGNNYKLPEDPKYDSNLYSSYGIADAVSTSGGANIYKEGEKGFIFSEWKLENGATKPNNDGNNNIQLNLNLANENFAETGIVYSASVTQLCDTFDTSTGSFRIRILDKVATSNIDLNPVIEIATDGAVRIKDFAANENTVVYTLKKGVTTDIAIHIRVVKPTAPDAEGDLTTLTGDAFTAKYGKVVFDTYIDGVMVAEGTTLLNASNQKKISKTSGGAATGLATDFKIDYFAFNVNGGFDEGKDGDYEGKDVLRLDSLKAYTSNTYLKKANSTNTVEGYDLTINNGVLGLNYYLNLQGNVLADENAKVVFTTPRGVQEVAVKDVVAETNGSYKFTANVSSVEMASDITMEIKSGEKVYKVFMNGVASDTYTYSVQDYAEKLLSDATYGKIAKAMLNYGAYAQDYFKFDTENLANANCEYTTELDSVTIDVADPTQTGTGKKVAKLVLDTTTSIVIYDAEGNKIGEQTGISSKNLDYAYEIDCGTAGKVTVSVLAIGEKALASQSATAEYKELIKALKLFSDASEALPQ